MLLFLFLFHTYTYTNTTANTNTTTTTKKHIIYYNLKGKKKSNTDKQTNKQNKQINKKNKNKNKNLNGLNYWNWSIYLSISISHKPQKHIIHYTIWRDNQRNKQINKI